jgi:lipoprotein-releasing system permease protein
LEDNVRARRLQVAGIYQTNFAEYDNLFLITDIYTVNRLNGWKGNQVGGLEIMLKDYGRLEDVTFDLADKLYGRVDASGNRFCVRHVEQLNPLMFAWLEVLDVNIWVILVLMIGVSGFTMIAGLLIIIIERTSMIGVLKSLGANNNTVRRLFLWFAVFLIGRGMLWGNVIGLSVYFLQRVFGVFKLDPAYYYMDTVPMALNWWAFLLLNVGTMLASVLMLLGPSYLITRIHPANSMRYE